MPDIWIEWVFSSILHVFSQARNLRTFDELLDGYYKYLAVALFIATLQNTELP
jgi:hypothetical protein